MSKLIQTYLSISEKEKEELSYRFKCNDFIRINEKHYQIGDMESQQDSANFWNVTLSLFSAFPDVPKTVIEKQKEKNKMEERIEIIPYASLEFYNSIYNDYKRGRLYKGYKIIGIAKEVVGKVNCQSMYKLTLTLLPLMFKQENRKEKNKMAQKNDYFPGMSINTGGTLRNKGHYQPPIHNFPIQAKNQEESLKILKKVLKRYINNIYYFRGEICIAKLVQDSLESNTNAFICIGEKGAIVGITKILPKDYFYNQCAGKVQKVDEPYHIIAVEKQDIGSWIPLLKKIPKTVQKIKKETEKAARQGCKKTTYMNTVKVF